MRMTLAALLLVGAMTPAMADYNPATGQFTTGTATLSAANLNDALSKRVMQVGSVSWTVCQSGCTYTSPLDAWSAARGLGYFGAFGRVVIQVADGTYNLGTANFFTASDMSGVQIVGNAAHPENVVFQFSNAGNNLSAFAAVNGGRMGQAGAPVVDGVTITGVGARSDRSTWASQSYGAGAFALGSGSNINFGPHVVVQNFYYSVLADQGGRFVGDGSTYKNAGDSNLLARFGGVIQCLNCTLATAAHTFTDAYGQSETLGRNALAEGSASMYVDGSTASGGQIACFSSHTSASVWAHAVTATGCQYGVEAQQLGMIEAGHSHLTANGIGAYADTDGRMNLDAIEANANTYDGVQVNGGAATGSAINSHNNGSYGLKVMGQGRVDFYATQSLLVNNPSGPYYVEQASGCTNTYSPCTPPSKLIIN